MLKELFNLPPLVLKARHLSGSAFCLIDIGLPEQAVGGFPLGLGLGVEDRPTELSCKFTILLHFLPYSKAPTVIW